MIVLDGWNDLAMDIIIGEVKNRRIMLPPELKDEELIGVASLDDPRCLLLMSKENLIKDCHIIDAEITTESSRWWMEKKKLILSRTKLFDAKGIDYFPVDFHEQTPDDLSLGKCIILKPYYNSWHMVLGEDSVEYQVFRFLEKRVGAESIYRVKPFIEGGPIGSFFTKMIIGENEEYVEGHICPPHPNDYGSGVIEMSTERCRESMHYASYKEGRNVESDANHAWEIVVNSLAMRHKECGGLGLLEPGQFWYAYIIC